MSRIGPTGYTFTLDGYTKSNNTVGSAETLDGITEFSGITETAEVVDVTTIGESHRSQGPIGITAFESITMRGFIDATSGGIAATSAFARIGRPAHRADYPPRTLTVTHRSGVTEALEVVPVKNAIMPQKDGLTMFEAEFVSVADATTEYSTTGF